MWLQHTGSSGSLDDLDPVDSSNSRKQVRYLLFGDITREIANEHRTPVNFILSEVSFIGIMTSENARPSLLQTIGAESLHAVGIIVSEVLHMFSSVNNLEALRPWGCLQLEGHG